LSDDLVLPSLSVRPDAERDLQGRLSHLPVIDANVPAPRRQELAANLGGAELSDEETVVAYHERTKHHPHRFAASLGYMDWARQPDPFRRYDGAPLARFPLPTEGRALPFWQIYATDSVKPAPLSIESLSLLFRYALSLTAWKRFHETTWSLRANPSSGNLHPTEGYVLLPAVGAIHDSPGVYHYAPREHGLERRAELAPEGWKALTAALPESSFLVGLSSIHWREAWKYGERAFRYCQHDVGHALGTLRFAAATLGWKLVLLDRVGESTLGWLLGLDRDADFEGAEREHPELLALVVPGAFRDARDLHLPDAALREAVVARWSGRANALGPDHGVDWPVIAEVSWSASRPTTPTEEDFSGFPSDTEIFAAPVRSGSFTAERVILGRRSAVGMDASTAISAETFFRMMGRLMPTRGRRAIPWDAIPWRPRIHLGLFVHRVNGLSPGLYALARDPDKIDALRHALGGDLRWRGIPSCPPGLPLYLLREGDCRALAASVSCGQDIAGDGAFSLAMLADYTDGLIAYGAGFYRNLFWEAGLVGQVLYLEAEEAGIRSTGIGCYFDDPVHAVFGISSRDWQSFYHFSVGGPVEDARLTTVPAYRSEAER
jgi:SagB-type dehydrogenase family enzyme